MHSTHQATPTVNGRAGGAASAAEWGRPPKSHSNQIIRRYRVQVDDVSTVGCVAGGTLLEWIFAAAYAVAAQWSDGRCVLTSVGNMHLDRPIVVGELVDVHASLVYTAESSLHLLVTICSYDPDRANSGQISQCPMVFVAVTDNGDPVVVSRWNPVTMLELQRQRQARARVRMRERIEDALANQGGPPNGLVPQLVSRVLTVPADSGPAVQDGRLLRWFDEAACACGADWTGVDMVTSYLAGICVQGAAVAGDVVEVTARMIHTGPRSVHASVRITSSDPLGGRPRVVAHGLAVVVSLDEHSDAQPVRRWRAHSAQDVRLDQHARHLIALRQFIEPFTTAAVPAEDITTY